MTFMQAKNYLETLRRAYDAASTVLEQIRTAPEKIQHMNPREFIDMTWGPMLPDRFDSNAYRDMVAREVERRLMKELGEGMTFAKLAEKKREGKAK